MTAKTIAAILVALALPAGAQAVSAPADARPGNPAQVKEDKAKAATPASTRERAKAAKAQKKKTRQKPGSQKKAPAS